MKIAEVTQQFTQEDLRAAHDAYAGEPTRPNLERVWAIQNVLYPRDPEPQEPQTPMGPIDYRGEHQAPMAGDGAAMWDATMNGIYPADFYTHGFQYYSNGPDDNLVISTMYRLRGRPNAILTVYRAIPKQTPRGTKVNRGDWVTPVRRYALEHGRGHLNEPFRIIKMLVKARDIFTDGNSLQEWGYDPQPRVGPSVSELARQRAANPVTESTQPQAIRTYWHVTPHTRIKAILAQGLNFGHKPQWKNVFGGTLGERRKIYLFSDMDAAIQMAARLEWGLKSEKRKITQVDIIELQTDVPVEEDPNSGAYGDMGKWWMTTEPIPPAAFVRVFPLTVQMTRDFIARRDGRTVRPE